ncbi:hypothetical protein Tco_1343163 [Tanacetum coccineum]
MNQAPKQKEVRQVIYDNSLCMCTILELHVANSNLQGLCSKVFKHWQWTSNGLIYAKGSRIILGWNPNIVNIIVISFDDQIYLTACFVAKLGTHKGYVQNRPWCVLRDFNVSLSVDDKSIGSSYIDMGMHDFQACVEELEVSDVNSTGLRYTWNQKPKGDYGILKKIDQIMVNIEFYTSFVGASALFQPYQILDHFPNVLRVPMISVTKPRPLKFSNFLVHNTRFKEIIMDGWQVLVSGFWMFKVVKRLKLLKKPLRKLLYDHGNIHNTEVAYLQAFNDALFMQERFLMQKAKVEWLQLGNENTAYFHKVVKSQASRNQIDSITTSNGVCVDGDQVPLAFIDHYTAFLGQHGVTSHFNSTNLFCNQITNDIANHKVRDVFDQEIHDAVFAIGDNKAPDQDGYSFAFFKEAWDIISGDVSRSIKEFFTNGVLLKELNHTIIALILKITAPMGINDYRPISCCNVLYKFISRIISNRMKDILINLVNLNQSAFVPSRRIFNNILLTQEMMHNYHLDRGTPRCAFKVDIQKEYDTVDWNFL